ncbi:putative nucleotidyltransferase substrate binding domain-containing protein [Aquisalimonas sp.]|uniref:putative nucleotidyltransferase substrate binding domain-containing protein n=1 Tax=Aquisalimonas sp. TaxID=1872621 RepID=UPI0025C45619|nr:putative nucleotidyltransferase substrate binding domain-containing protein [Aquisalimonas sp.]
MAVDVNPQLEALARCPPFSGLDAQTFNALAHAGVTESRPVGDRLVLNARDTHTLFIVCSGEVELLTPGKVGTREGCGAMLGLDQYLEQEPRYSEAVILERTALLRLEYETLRRLEQAHPSLSGIFNQIIARRIRDRGISHANPQGALAEPVHRIMNAPLAGCSVTSSLCEAYESMRRRKIGSLGVTGEAGELVGVATLDSLAEATMVHWHLPDASVRHACRSVEAVDLKTPLWQAEALQKRKGVKYLVVMDGDRPLGMLSQTNILNALLEQQGMLLNRVAESGDLERLAVISAEVAEVARDAWERNRDATRAVLLLSDFHLAVQRRCIELTIAGMRDEGFGDAPRRFAFLIMGSGGRREMLLNPDQDNAIIIDDDAGDAPLSDAEKRWFRVVTERVNVNLDRVGYVLCPGDIMARNPEYQRTLSLWCRRIDHITAHPNETAARWANILFDFDLLYGDSRLSRALWDHTLRALAERPRLLRFMADDNAQGRPALGLFNRLITADDAERRGRVDIKRNGLRLICDAARIFALHSGVADANTVDRLQAVVRQGELEAEFVDSVRAAHEVLMDLLLSHQLHQSAEGTVPDKLVRPDALDPLARESLRMAMYAVKRFQERLQGRFGL